MAPVPAEDEISVSRRFTAVGDVSIATHLGELWPSLVIITWTTHRGAGGWTRSAVVFGLDRANRSERVTIGHGAFPPLLAELVVAFPPPAHLASFDPPGDR